MRSAYALLAVATGGALGSILRYAIASWSVVRFGPGLPWGTFAINVSGSFMLGLVYGLAARRLPLGTYARLFLTTGFLGGYTTFSAFAFETYALGASGAAASGAAYACGSVAFGVLGAYAGMLVAQAIPA